MTLKPRVSYLLPGALDWVIDSGETPYLIVYARHNDAVVPNEYVQEDGTIVLNVSGPPYGTSTLTLQSSVLIRVFQACLSSSVIPYEAVLGMIGKESGQGIYFPENHPGASEPLVTEATDQAEETSEAPTSKEEASGPAT